MRVTNSDNNDSYFSKRRRRFDEEQTARSLTFSCYRGFTFLNRDRVRVWFVDAVNNAREKFAVDLWAWVLMPEHVHMLIFPREEGDIVGKFQGFVKEQVARKAIAWLEGNAPEWISKITVTEGERKRRRFWQPGGGYDRNIYETNTLLSTIDYIHANPVRRDLVERPTDWEWSSARWYAGMSDTPLKMDRTMPMFEE